VTTRKQHRDRVRQRERRRLAAWRKLLNAQLVEIEHAEQTAARLTGAHGEARAKHEAAEANYADQLERIRVQTRAHVDRALWVDSHWRSLTPSERVGLHALWWLDQGRAWVDRTWRPLTPARAAERIVALVRTKLPTRPPLELVGGVDAPPHADDRSELGGIPQAAWVAALTQWKLVQRKPDLPPTGWSFGRKKGGRPKAGVTVYRPHVVLQALLAAGGLRRSTAKARDADVIRQRVDRALKKANIPR
jgi:hypothetical protein